MAVALIAGPTGLVGSMLLELILADSAYDRAIALSRRPLPQHPKLDNRIGNFESLMEESGQDLRADDVFCCLGTTIRQAGSQEAFRKVDFGYPLALAKATHAQGARQFVMITALGSDKNSSIFYNRVKGEVEEAVGAIGFESLHIIQPSMLLGDRKEARGGESMGKSVMKALDFVIPKKYKAIDAAKVARAMIAIAKQHQQGRHIHSSGELQEF